jgi:hypothetical protein
MKMISKRDDQTINKRVINGIQSNINNNEYKIIIQRNGGEGAVKLK